MSQQAKRAREWKWPAEHELIDWERQARDKHAPHLGKQNTLKLVRAVRSQRKVIEKLARLLSEAK